jgi:hypothetical protein
MSLYDWTKAVELRKNDVPFYALLMAAVLRADDLNLAKLNIMFPAMVTEVQARYDAPGGKLEGE